MLAAVQRIAFARNEGQRIMIFGDYDVDGVSSTAALFFLRDELQIDVSYRLPHRVHDGYGIKVYHMDEIAQKGTKLVITVDCGTKDREPIEHAKKIGMDVIVTDHHSCPEELPHCIAVVNPKKKRLSLSFFWSLWFGRGMEDDTCSFWFFFPEKLNQCFVKYVDIVSLGSTVADCMPMIDENRTIVRQGILQSQSSHHPFFQTFVDTLKKPILTEEDIWFLLGLFSMQEVASRLLIRASRLFWLPR